MADSNVKDSVGYQLGELNGKTEGLQEGLKELTKRVDNGFERQTQATNELKQEVKSDLDKHGQESDARFLWSFGVVAVPLNIALLGLLAHFLGWV